MPPASDPAANDDLTSLPRGIRLRVAAVCVVAFGIMFLLVWLLSGGFREFFRVKATLTAYLADASGIEKGSEVRLNGVRIGHVPSVSLVPNATDPQRAVRVVLEIEKRHLSEIPADSIAALTADNLLGDQYVNVEAGKSTRHVEDGQELASLVQQGSFNPADLIASLRATVQRVDILLTQIQDRNSPMGQIIMGDAVYRKVFVQLIGLRKEINTYADPSAPLGQLIYSDALYNQVRQFALNLDSQLDQLQRAENPAGKLLSDPSLYDNGVKQIRSIRASMNQAAAGQGTAGRLLTNDEDYDKLEAQVRSINSAVDDLTMGDGPIARMLQTSQLYDELSGRAAHYRDFVKDFREHPQKYLRLKLF